MSTPRIPSQSFSPSLSMESTEAVSSGFLPLPPEPPDSDPDGMFPVNPPVPPVPPDPPPILIDACVLSVQPLLKHPVLDEADLSSPLTTRRVYCFLQLFPVSKPRNLVSCGEHVSFKSLRQNLPYYQQEAWVTEILVVRLLGLLTADCKLTFLPYSTLQVLVNWTSNVEILVVVVGFLNAAFITSWKLFGVQLSTAMCSTQSEPVLHLKPWLQVVGPISPYSMLSQGMMFVSYWSESFLFDHCLREQFNCFSRRSLLPCKQELMLFLNGSLPRIEDVINPLSFTFKLHLPQYEAVIWISVFVALDDIVSGWSIWSWWLDSQQSTFWKRCLVASELIDVSSLVGYVENFPTCSANGTWIGSSTQTLQKVLHASLSSGLSNLQILVDSIVPLLALCSGLVLIEITGILV
ncbi:hypothetical protein Bca4012_026042 [Brassica carinata]